MIAINFASKNYRVTAVIGQVFVALSLVLALTAAGLAWKAVALRREAEANRAKLHEAEARDAQLAPVLVERERLSKLLGSMADVLEARKFSWIRLLDSLESVVPVGVAVGTLSFNPKDRTLSIEGTATSPESLRNLVVGLEKSKSFREPFLKHQSIEKGSISFNVVARYQEDQAGVVRSGR